MIKTTFLMTSYCDTGAVDAPKQLQGVLILRMRTATSATVKIKSRKLPIENPNDNSFPWENIRITTMVSAKMTKYEKKPVAQLGIMANEKIVFWKVLMF